MFAAPLEVGADLRNTSKASASILRNPEVIAVDQDPLVRQARRVYNTNGLQVWRKDLADGSVAVALYNANDPGITGKIPLVFEEVGFSACDRVSVRDLLERRDVGVQS